MGSSAAGRIARPVARRIAALAVAVLAVAAPLAVARAQGVVGTVTVDAGRALGAISPFVYGANYGPLGAITPELFDDLEAAGLRFLRFPGGAWGDLNDIQPYQIDLLMRVAEMAGAEPSVHVRLLDGTPERAADLVRYANVEKGYDIRYWYIGNEPSLFDDYTVDDLNRQWRAIALAMLAVDPDLVLIGPEPHQWNGTPEVDPRDPEGREWVRGFLEANGDLVDVVAVHRYPFPRSTADPATTVDDLRRNAAEWGEIVPRLRALAEEVTGRDDLRFAVTEANSHWSATIGGEATNDSHASAVWWADALGRLIEDGAFIVAYFDLQSASGRGGWGLLDQEGPRPSYWVYRLYRHFGDELLAAEASAPSVSAYAARRDDGAITLIVVNLGDDPASLALEVRGAAPVDPVEARLFDETHPAESVDVGRLYRDGALALPRRSAALLVFPAAP